MHTFCHQIADQDALIVHLGDTLVASGAEWFFLRYWLGGPHVRFRASGLDDDTWARFLQAAAEFFERRQILDVDRTAYYSGIASSMREGHVDDDALAWFNSGVVLESEYVPELTRYGGESLMAISELTFHASSLLGLEIVRITQSRAGRMAAGAYVFHRLVDELDFAAYLRRYKAYWAPNANSRGPASQTGLATVIERVVDGRITIPALDPLVDRMVATLVVAKPALEPDSWALLVSSHLHMMNNRLSISPALEADLSRLVTGVRRAAVDKS